MVFCWEAPDNFSRSRRHLGRVLPGASKRLDLGRVFRGSLHEAFILGAPQDGPKIAKTKAFGLDVSCEVCCLFWHSTCGKEAWSSSGSKCFV